MTIPLPLLNDTPLQSGQVYLIAFDCRRRGLEDDGAFEGYWTGEYDTWGKLTLRAVDGGPEVYLFPDEIYDAEMSCV